MSHESTHPPHLSLSDFSLSDFQFTSRARGEQNIEILLGVQGDYHVNGHTFIPDPDQYGEMMVPVTLSNGEIFSPPYMTKIIVHNVNDIPVANDDEFRIEKDSKDNMLDVLDNDTGLESGTSVKIIDVTTTGQGQVKISGKQLVYTPPSGFVGEENMTYQIRDEDGEMDDAKIRIIVSNGAQVHVNSSSLFWLHSALAFLCWHRRRECRFYEATTPIARSC